MSSLVTVIVVTYNSSAFIAETLESVYKQTWHNLELIITDDCSADNTVEVCRAWLNLNSKRFIDIRILTSEKNTGVSANANRGLNSSKGAWVKYLAGDDTLKPTCIENNMSWIADHPEIRVLFSMMDVYKDTFENHNYITTTPGDSINHDSILAPDRSAESQYRMLLVSDRVHFTPSVFLHRDTLISVGGFDDRYRLLEDYPLWLVLTKNNYRLCWMDSVTVNYRQHSKAINNTGADIVVNPNYFRSENFRQVYTYPFLPADIRCEQKFKWYASQIFRLGFLNTNNKATRFLYKLLSAYLNPFRYIIYFRKRLIKSLGENEFYN